MEKIVGVKFKNTPKVYYFAPETPDSEYKEGEGVIVETAKGPEYAVIVFGTKEVEDDKVIQPLKPVIRRITEKEAALMKENDAKAFKTAKIAEEKAIAHGLDMKISGAEYSFDGKKIVFYFTSDTRVDFRELVKDLASTFKSRIELHQIGVRDETKMFGGLGPCGRPCCCNGAIPDFKKVSIKMAKTQGLSLNPTKISGLCGRLMCCLDYENDYYAETSKIMPKVGSQINTPDGTGVVVSDNMLKLLVKVKISKPDGSEVYKDFTLEELGAAPSCKECSHDCRSCSRSECDSNKEAQTLEIEETVATETLEVESAAERKPVKEKQKENKKYFDKKKNQNRENGGERSNVGGEKPRSAEQANAADRATDSQNKKPERNDSGKKENGEFRKRHDKKRFNKPNGNNVKPQGENKEVSPEKQNGEKPNGGGNERKNFRKNFHRRNRGNGAERKNGGSPETPQA